MVVGTLLTSYGYRELFDSVALRKNYKLLLIPKGYTQDRQFILGFTELCCFGMGSRGRAGFTCFPDLGRCTVNLILCLSFQKELNLVGKRGRDIWKYYGERKYIIKLIYI